MYLPHNSFEELKIYRVSRKRVTSVDKNTFGNVYSSRKDHIFFETSVKILVPLLHESNQITQNKDSQGLYLHIYIE